VTRFVRKKEKKEGERTGEKSARSRGLLDLGVSWLGFFIGVDVLGLSKFVTFGGGV